MVRIVLGEHGSKSLYVTEKLIESSLQIRDETCAHYIKHGLSPDPSKSKWIHSPSVWLSVNSAKVILVPGMDAFDGHEEEVENALYHSDLIILATEPDRGMTGTLERHLLEFLAKGKQNILVAVQKTPEQSLHRIETRIAHNVINKYSRDFEIRLPPIVEITEDIKAIVGLVSIALNRRDDAQERKRLFMGYAALGHALECHDQALNHLETTESTLNTTFDLIQTHQTRLKSEFKDKDMAELQGSLVSFKSSLSESLANFPFWKLFWHSDDIHTHLSQVLKDHPLLRIEHQMSFAMGKASESLASLLGYLVSAVESVRRVSSSHPVSIALLADLERLQSFIQKQIPPIGPDVDPFVLRNEVAEFDQWIPLQQLHDRGCSLVREQIIMQLSTVFTFLGGWYLGVPLAIGIPSILLGSSASLFWMKLRWASAQRRMFNQLASSQGRLKERLAILFDQEYGRAVTATLKTSTSMIQESIENRKKEWTTSRDLGKDLMATLKARFIKTPSVTDPSNKS